jgi:hypothetical protein
VIRDYFTGEPVSGALVTLRAASFNKLVEVNADNDSLELSLLPAQLVTSFAAGASTSLNLDNGLAVADLPANAFGSNGNAYDGTVNTQVTVLNPSGDPSILPGSYTVLDEQGQASLLSTYGAVTFDFTDENSEPLQLNNGTPATIRIPLADGLDPSDAPATAPLAWFDEESGQWIQESVATLDVVNQYYEGQITHFTTWNAAEVYTPVEVAGRVVDGEGNALAGALMELSLYSREQTRQCT